MIGAQMTPTPVTIIILTWNALEYTKRCLETLRRATTFGSWQLIVVDNGSTDGTVDFLEGQAWVRLLRNATNEGFVRGCNRGIRAADPESDIILLNNDTEIDQVDWIERMQATAYADPRNGVVGCRLQQTSGALLHAGTYMPPSYWGQQIGSNERDVNQFNRDREVEGVVFACVYLKREVLDRVGLLDEDYVSYYEDTDYCRKAQRLGYRVMCCGSLTILHHENVSSAANHVEHATLFLPSQRVFRDKWEGEIESRRYRQRVCWRSIMNAATGYAISSRALMLALEEQGVEVAYQYAYGPGSPCPAMEPEATGDYRLEYVRRRPAGDDDVQVTYAQGDAFAAGRGARRIGFTMLEIDRLPPEWVRQANLMDEIFVPSTFNAETFRTSGVERPISVVPLGVDPDYFNPGITGHPLARVFSFLSAFEWGARKAPEVLLRAFHDEFRATEEVVLICKIINVDESVRVERAVADLGLTSGGGRVLFSLNEIVPASQLGSVYRSADCFVLPTRGEGWGMPILEAMACGLPVIATDWSAQRDFMNAGNAYPLEVERLVPAELTSPYYRGARWAEPSYEHLRGLMRHVYENRDEARAKGLRASQEVLSRWTWEGSASRISALLAAGRA